MNLTSGVITTVAGAAQGLSNVWGFVLDPAGHIYIPDYATRSFGGSTIHRASSQRWREVERVPTYSFMVS